MKTFVDGDHIVLANDDFIDMQSSSTVIIPMNTRSVEQLCEVLGAITMHIGSDPYNVVVDFTKDSSFNRMLVKKGHKIPKIAVELGWVEDKPSIHGLIEGRMVHYVVKNNHRPAIIVHVYRDAEGRMLNGKCCLTVFPDLMADFEAFGNLELVQQVRSVMYSDNKEHGTWHFIERTD